MPIPEPTTDEQQSDFIGRCMADDKMLLEYPDSKQRYSICQMKWESKKQ